MGPIIGNILVDFYYYYLQFTCPTISLAENYPYITYKVFGTLLNFYMFIGVIKVMSSKAEFYILTQKSITQDQSSSTAGSMPISYHYMLKKCVLCS